MKNWIKSAVSKPGSFSLQAKRFGLPVPVFTKKVISEYKKAKKLKIRSPFNLKTYRRAILARTFSKMGSKK